MHLEKCVGRGAVKGTKREGASVRNKSKDTRRGESGVREVGSVSLNTN